MTDAHYTLRTRDGSYGFRMEDVDFSAGRLDMSIGLGETVVDSMHDLGAPSADVLIEDPWDESRKGIIIRGVKFDPDAPRHRTILGIGTKMADATYIIHADHIKGAA